MYPRTNYEMTEEDLKKILSASKPPPYIINLGWRTSNPQENANRAWKELGDRMGFDSMTVRPGNSGKGMRFFSAIPLETDLDKANRLEKEKKDERLKEINDLEKDIKSKQYLLKELIKMETPEKNESVGPRPGLNPECLGMDP